jgi:hypothetical protein
VFQGRRFGGAMARAIVIHVRVSCGSATSQSLGHLKPDSESIYSSSNARYSSVEQSAALA